MSYEDPAILAARRAALATPTVAKTVAPAPVTAPAPTVTQPAPTTTATRYNDIYNAATGTGVRDGLAYTTNQPAPTTSTPKTYVDANFAQTHDMSNPMYANYVVGTDPALSRYTTDPGMDDPRRDAPTPEDEESIRKQATSAMQAQIDAINANYNALTAEENARIDTLGTKSAARVRGLNVGAGLAGSPDASAAAMADEKNLSEYRKRSLDVLNAEKEAKLSEIYTGIQKRVDDELKIRREEALGKFTDYTAKREADQKAAREDLGLIAAEGGALTPQQKQVLMQQTGYDEFTFDLKYNYGKKQAERVDYKWETKVDPKTGKTVIWGYGINPKTGQLEQKSYDTTLPANKEIQIVGDTPYYNDGDKLVKVPGFEPKPVELSPGNILVDPVTGKTTAKNPKPVGTGVESVYTKSNIPSDLNKELTTNATVYRSQGLDSDAVYNTLLSIYGDVDPSYLAQLAGKTSGF